MLSNKHLLLILVAMMLGGLTVQAQKDGGEYPYPEFRTAEYKDFVKKKRQDQHDKFMDYKYMYPAPPKNQWEVGINAGLLMISGDVKAKPGLGIGGHVRKSLGYVFSLRGSFMAGTTYGANWQLAQGWSVGPNGVKEYPNSALSGGWTQVESDGTVTEFYEDAPDYRGKFGDLVAYNYKTQIRELVISGVVNLNNIKFHKRRNLVTVYGYAGIGGLLYKTMMDQLDADGNEYDYSVLALDQYNEYDERSSAIDVLNDLWDGEYESQAERHWDDWTPIKNWSYKPTAHVGVGIAFKLHKRINLALDTKVTYTNDDLLDGQRWQEWGALTRHFDTYTYTSAQLNVNLGGKNTVEPLWWMNPINYDCNCEIPEPEKLEDTDGDGVPDPFDEEEDSRKDCPVDTRGRMLDSDKDGVLDCDDDQPHTPHHLISQVDENGVAMDPCCKDTVYVQVENNCKDDAINLPDILFDLDKYGVKADFYPQLDAVARKMQDCQDLRICVTGHTDARASNSYNDVLSWKRANEVINYLVTKHGIQRNRLILQYRGENELLVSSLSGHSGGKGFDKHALNRRVSFRNCSGAMVSDMPMPDGPNAGKK